MKMMIENPGPIMNLNKGQKMMTNLQKMMKLK